MNKVLCPLYEWKIALITVVLMREWDFLPLLFVQRLFLIYCFGVGGYKTHPCNKKFKDV